MAQESETGIGSAACLEVDGDLAAAGTAALLHDGLEGVQRPQRGLPGATVLRAVTVV